MPIKDKTKLKAARRAYYLAHREFEINSSLIRKVRARVSKLHAEWRKTHIMRCTEYPLGTCCHRCHASLLLDVVELDTGDVGYVCCYKRMANLVGLHKHSVYSYCQATHGTPSLSHAEPVAALPKNLYYDPKEISKLPDGLLKSYLTQR